MLVLQEWGTKRFLCSSRWSISIWRWIVLLLLSKFPIENLFYSFGNSMVVICPIFLTFPIFMSVIFSPPFCVFNFGSWENGMVLFHKIPDMLQITKLGEQKDSLTPKLIQGQRPCTLLVGY